MLQLLFSFVIDWIFYVNSRDLAYNFLNLKLKRSIRSFGFNKIVTSFLCHDVNILLVKSWACKSYCQVSIVACNSILIGINNLLLCIYIILWGFMHHWLSFSEQMRWNLRFIPLQSKTLHQCERQKERDRENRGVKIRWPKKKRKGEIHLV